MNPIDRVAVQLDELQHAARRAQRAWDRGDADGVKTALRRVVGVIVELFETVPRVDDGRVAVTLGLTNMRLVADCELNGRKVGEMSMSMEAGDDSEPDLRLESGEQSALSRGETVLDAQKQPDTPSPHLR